MKKILPIKILDAYLIREFLFSYVICVATMISLYIILDLFANIDEFMETSKTILGVLSNIGRYYYYNSFLYYAQIAGLIVMIAMAFTLTRLHRSNETTAILTSGISMYRVALPLIITGFILNVFWFIDQEFIIPSIADKLVLSHDEISGSESFSLWFLKDRNNSLLSVASFNPQTKTMEHIIIIERNEKGQIIAKISADQAYWDEQKKVWKLKNGIKYYRPSKTKFALSAEIQKQPVEYYKSDWKPEELVLRQTLNWTWFLSLRQLSKLLSKPYLIPNLNEIIAIRHVRFTQPILNLLLIFLGLPFFLNRERTHILSSIGLCLALSLLCYLVAIICQNMATSSQHPGLLVWLPIMIFGPIATLLMENIKT